MSEMPHFTPGPLTDGDLEGYRASATIHGDKFDSNENACILRLLATIDRDRVQMAQMTTEIELADELTEAVGDIMEFARTWEALTPGDLRELKEAKMRYDDQRWISAGDGY